MWPLQETGGQRRTHWGMGGGEARLRGVTGGGEGPGALLSLEQVNTEDLARVEAEGGQDRRCRSNCEVGPVVEPKLYAWLSVGKVCPGRSGRPSWRIYSGAGTPFFETEVAVVCVLALENVVDVEELCF